MTDDNRCRVIGVLDDGLASLNETARQHLAQAQCVIGGHRLLHTLAGAYPAQARIHDLTGALKAVPGWVRAAQADGLRTVVLASGDPLCHGIATYLAAHLCIEALEILPNLSSLQLACARLGLPWQALQIVSVHSRDSGEWQPGATPDHALYALAQVARRHDRLGIFTSPANTPARLARLLITEGLGEAFEWAIAENLGQATEQVYKGLTATQVADSHFSDLNVVLLWRKARIEHPVLLGLPDDAYHQRQPDKGLITKREVRAVSLARLELRSNSVVWDIGAGSGSLGLEAARLCADGHVYAIEKNAADVEIARHNHTRMAVSNYSLQQGKAPEGLEHWPDPDAVFIGGSGGELAELIQLCLKRLRPGGRLVMNFVTLENLACATQALAHAEVEWDVVQLQASRSKPILHMHRLAAENPVWVVCARREITHD